MVTDRFLLPYLSSIIVVCLLSTHCLSLSLSLSLSSEIYPCPFFLFEMYLILWELVNINVNSAAHWISSDYNYSSPVIISTPVVYIIIYIYIYISAACPLRIGNVPTGRRNWSTHPSTNRLRAVFGSSTRSRKSCKMITWLESIHWSRSSRLSFYVDRLRLCVVYIQLKWTDERFTDWLTSVVAQLNILCNNPRPTPPSPSPSDRGEWKAAGGQSLTWEAFAERWGRRIALHISDGGDACRRTIEAATDGRLNARAPPSGQAVNIINHRPIRGRTKLEADVRACFAFSIVQEWVASLAHIDNTLFCSGDIPVFSASS